MRIQNGGYVIHQGMAKIRSGKAECVAVVAADTTKTNATVVSNISQEPLYHRPFGEPNVTSHARLANEYLETSDVIEEDLARVAANNYAGAAETPWALRRECHSLESVLDSDRFSSPLRELMTAPVSYGAAIVVIAAESLAEPLYERRFVTAIQMGALPSSAYMDAFSAIEEDFAKYAAKNYAAAANNPYGHRTDGKTVDDVLDSPLVSWSLRRLMTSPVSSGSAAMVLAAEDTARELSETPVWIDAVDSVSNTFSTCYRTYEWFPKLNTLSDRVYDEAGIDDPRSELDLAETFNPYIPFELMEYEALGLCEKGDGKHLVSEGATAPDGDIPVNPSGGVLTTNSGICASLSWHTRSSSSS